MIFPSLLAVSALLSLAHAIPQVFSSTVITPSATQASSPTGTAACNNSPQLCNRNYNNITHMGIHNAAFLRDRTTGFSQSGNQFYNVTVSLSAGIRLLQAQVHNENGTARLCHSSCTLLDAGPLLNWLREIKTWMDANPSDVVTILLVNSDGISTSSLGSVFTSSGISKYGYTPTSREATSNWPTLQTLITANTRLVTFITNIDYDTSNPYLLPEFDYIFETAFGVTSLNGFNCTLDRPSTIGSANAAISLGFMGLVNHFLDEAQSFFQSPDTANLTTTNSVSTTTTGALGMQAQQCQSQWGLKPTFILVNFFNVGPAIATADLMNGITAVGRSNLTTALLDASSASGAFKGDAASWSMVAAVGMVVVALGNFIWM